jgi:predicted deacetylase
MRIHVGILGADPGWRILLRQEGIPHSRLTGSASAAEISAMAVSGGISPEDLEIVRSFLAGGGALLCPGSVFGPLSGGRTKRSFIRHLLGDESGRVFNPELTDLFTEGEIPVNANSLRSGSGTPSAYVGEFGGGHVVVLPFDPAALANDRRVATKSFYAVNRRLPFERVSLVSKGGLLRIVSRALTILHHRRGLPYVHRWYYPSDRQSLFAFRIDTDYAARPEVEALRDLARASKIPLTWFVDVGSQKDFLSLFGEMAGDENGDEVGVHCFHHRAYPDPAAHAENIRKAVRAFESAGLRARSYAAPYGLWSERLAEAVEQFKFVYSSEFSYDYDDLPSVPHLPAGFISTLQVPVHPISIGSLRRQGFREEEMTAYYRALIDRKIQAREPVFLYHHPKNAHPRVLEKVFEMIHERGLEKVRMIDFASWWMRRGSDECQISIEGSSVRVGREAAADSPVPWLHIIRPDGMEAFTEPGSGVELDSLDWKAPPAWPPLPSDIGRTRRFNPWIPIIRAQDKTTSLLGI